MLQERFQGAPHRIGTRVQLSARKLAQSGRMRKTKRERERERASYCCAVDPRSCGVPGVAVVDLRRMLPSSALRLGELAWSREGT